MLETLPADDKVEESLEAFNKKLYLDDVLNSLDTLGSKVKASTNSVSTAPTLSRRNQSMQLRDMNTALQTNTGDSDVEPLAKKTPKPQTRASNNFFLDDSDSSDTEPAPQPAKGTKGTRARKATKTETNTKTTAGRGRGRGRGRVASAAPTRSTRQALDVSINSTVSQLFCFYNKKNKTVFTQRSTLLESLANARAKRGTKCAQVIHISDSE